MKQLSIFLSLMLAFGPNLALSQSYLKGPAYIDGTTTVTTAGGTTTLTKDSNPVQILSGTNSQTVVLPSATTLPVGRAFEFYSTTTKVVTIQANGGTVLKTLAPNEKSQFRLTANGTAAGTWAVENNAAVNIAQAVFFGGMEQATLGNGACTYSENTSSGSSNFVDLGTGTTCGAWTISSGSAGTVAAVGTNDHRITASNMAPGIYEIDVSGTFVSNASGQLCTFRLSDGTTSYQPQSIAAVGGAVYVPAMKFSVLYTTPQSSVTFKIQASDNGASNCFIDSGTGGAQFAWKIKYFPSQSQTAVRMDQSDTDWQTYTPTITGFGTPTAVSAEWRRNGDSIEIRGTFTSGTATAVEGQFGLPTGITTASTTRIPTKRPAGVISNQFNGEGSYFLIMEPSTTYVTFGRQSSGTQGMTKLNGSGFLGSGNQIYFTSLPIPVNGWTSNQNAPLLVGGVTSSSTGLEKIERAKIAAICNVNGACAIQNKTSGISAITRTAAGNYNITFTANTWSVAPTCTYSSNQAILAQIADLTTSGTTIRTRTVGDVDTDFTYFNMLCMAAQ